MPFGIFILYNNMTPLNPPQGALIKFASGRYSHRPWCAMRRCAVSEDEGRPRRRESRSRFRVFLPFLAPYHFADENYSYNAKLLNNFAHDLHKHDV